ncbi:NAD(P)H-dependent oxidoreductase [Actinomyces wuliandei]|uniref:NAD(P)H-dependent oxidoreductase n=1 Tax=Actinomyces wuliandei TaxID=2057743 RepID=UPI0027D7E9BB|nr:NAD(P)H-dependent oxidoreductase [Actinomyces wuliandei]
MVESTETTGLTEGAGGSAGVADAASAGGAACLAGGAEGQQGPRRPDDAYDRTQMGRLVRLVTVHAGLGTPSTSAMLAERLTEATRRHLAEASRLASAQVVALRPLASDIALAGVGGPVSEPLREAIDALAQADGIIAVSPVLQASYSGLFKGFMDVLP